MHLNIDIEDIRINKIDVINNFSKLIQINEGPIGGITNISNFILCQKVKSDGYNILITGHGLDEALYGYNTLNLYQNSNLENFKILMI